MNSRYLLVVVLCLVTLLVDAGGQAVASEAAAAFRIAAVDESVPEALGRRFAKQVEVFGVKLLATKSTPDNKVLHAANVMAQYLDNDADGSPDNPAVIKAMAKNKATLVMFATAREAEHIMEQVEENITDELDAMILQDLYGTETHPGGAARGEFDASYEEVLHLITHAGYAFAYPKVFGEQPGTKLGDAMDKARGGRFLRIPPKYPKQAWYTYYDPTCDYGCQATEYIYWGLTSLLGAQSFPGRAAEIAEEWRLSTPEQFKQGDPTLYNLLTDKRYKLPTVLPDGKYKPPQK